MKKQIVLSVLLSITIGASLSSVSTDVFAASASKTSTVSKSDAKDDDEYGVLAGYKLKKTSTVDHESGMSVSYDSLIAVNEEGGIITFEDGSTSDTIINVSALGSNYILGIDDSEKYPNNKGLFSADGEELIPYEAAIFKWVNPGWTEDDSVQHRYVNVTYGEDVTEDKSEAFFYATEDAISLTADDDDTLYTGYGKIYDTEEQQFVPNITLTSPSDEIYTIGDNLVVSQDGKVTLYDPSGEIIESFKNDSSSLSVGEDYFITRNNSIYVVHDEEGEDLFSSKESLYAIEGPSSYIKQYSSDDQAYLVLDEEGEQVFSDTYAYIYSESFGYLYAADENDNYMIIDPKGKTVLETDSNIYTECPGYYSYKAEDGTYTVFNLDGVVAEDLNSTNRLVLVDEDKATVLNTKKTVTLKGTTVSVLGTGLAAVKDDSTGYYGLVDFFTGKTLLKYNYDQIKATDTHIYAKADDEWEIYSLTPIYEDAD